LVCLSGLNISRAFFQAQAFALNQVPIFLGQAVERFRQEDFFFFIEHIPDSLCQRKVFGVDGSQVHRVAVCKGLDAADSFADVIVHPPHHFGRTFKAVFLKDREKQVFFPFIMAFNQLQVSHRQAQGFQGVRVPSQYFRQADLNGFEHTADDFIFQAEVEHRVTGNGFRRGLAFQTLLEDRHVQVAQFLDVRHWQPFRYHLPLSLGNVGRGGYGDDFVEFLLQVFNAFARVQFTDNRLQRILTFGRVIDKFTHEYSLFCSSVSQLMVSGHSIACCGQTASHSVQ